MKEGSGTAPPGIEAWLAETRAWADRELEHGLDLADEIPPRLAEAIRYAIFGGGKRLRPGLVRMISAHFGGSDAAAAPAAVAVECVHAYSLVHDDLPCMDDDELRRGRPTCHKVYGEALAVLAGDALLTLAFETLSRAGERAGELTGILARGAGPAGMVGGQVIDLEPPAALSRALVEEIHQRKTAALIAAAAELGAVVAGSGRGEREAAHAFGHALGRCFQATDDILDVTGDTATLGKTPGKDARKNKPTLVAALGLEGARAESRRLAEEARAAAERLGCRPGDLPLALIEYLLARRT